MSPMVTGTSAWVRTLIVLSLAMERSFPVWRHGGWPGSSEEVAEAASKGVPVTGAAGAVRRRDVAAFGDRIGRARWKTPRPAKDPAASPGLRFAFYGRMSTMEYQDRASSFGWQREAAEQLVAGRGVIVAEFFDAGCSRRLPWAQRPQAAALLSALADPERRLDAVVVGEYERAFSGDQFIEMAPLLQRLGVQVWLPEAGGLVEPGSLEHQVLMRLLGAQSQREVLRSRHRVLAAMRAQACEQGRFMGGRPPYGYRLVDAGPHPNRVHAEWGRRLRRLGVDPVTGRHVRWIFARRLEGWSMTGIARALNERGVPCPSHIDPERNRHRSGEAWTLGTVAAILGNPRYTGRQVWNRQRTDRDTAGAGGGRGGAVRRWNPVEEWVISEQALHPALVSDEDFLAAQTVRAARPTRDGECRVYALAGSVVCGICTRRMDSHWANGRAGYRCRHGHTSAKLRKPDQPRNLYVREDRLLAVLPGLLASFDRSLQDAGPGEIALFLRANNLKVVCDRSRWAISEEMGLVPLSPS
ncbi:recombinase family protein [Actinomadura sp. 9N215]|uniref:recombinase family protein n=1 Tax=Actinomadura sp. 9N215 TaxID=3375150 RepID=UPI00379044E0